MWLKLRTSDERDKLKQGIEEARKAAAADPYWAVSIFDAEVIEDVLFCAMELVKGSSLKEVLASPQTEKHHRWSLARVYLSGIMKTTTENVAHGDAHSSNVLVFNDVDEFGFEGKRLKFIDFGTSLYLGSEGWRNRHWRVVGETICKILAPFDTLKESRAIYDVSPHVGPYERLPDHLKTAYWMDVINDCRMEAGIDR